MGKIKNIQKLIHQEKIQRLIFFFLLGVLLWVFIPHILHQSKVGKVKAETIVNCGKVAKTHEIKISDSEFIPETTKITVCDEIVFNNVSNKYVDIGFGEHPAHLLYPNYKEKVLKPGEKTSLQMTAFGRFEIHEHIDDKIEGEIIISK